MNTKMMNENVKAATSATVTSPAPYFFYDHIREKICGTELNFKRSGIPGSAQDKALMVAKSEHPDYGYEVIKPKKEKKTYSGLTADLILDYLNMIGDKELHDKIKQMKDDGVGYPAMKSTFLDQFPKFNVEKAKKEIREYRLGNVKAKYKVTLAAPKNRPSTSNIADFPKASGQ